jgi:glycosyltransferase involved in cell wall biosynthesis
MRIVVFNRSFWPDVEGTAQQITGLCQRLSERHEVTVVAGPSLHVPTAGKGIWHREKLGRVSIVRTTGTTFSKSRLAGRLLNLGTHFVLAALAAFRAERPDLVVVNTDPPLLGALGGMLKRRWKCRLVYNVRDLYPDIAQANGAITNPAVLNFLERANKIAYEAADLVLTLGDDMARRIIAKGVSSRKVGVVSDWVDCGDIRPVLKGSLRAQLGDQFVVMYAGNVGLSQHLELVLEAAKRLRDDPRILFAIVGDGAKKRSLQAQASAAGLANIRFLPYQPKEKLADTLSGANLHLIPLAAGTSGCLVPSKVYGILAVGRPFVAMMDEDTDVARMARDHSIGFWVRPGDGEELARKIREACQNAHELTPMGHRARALAEGSFDLPIVAARFESAILGA